MNIKFLKQNKWALHDKTSAQCESRAITYLATKEIEREDAAYWGEQLVMTACALCCMCVAFYCIIA